MPKGIIAIGSFILGICFSLATFSLVYAPTKVHAQAVDIAGAEPVVPPLLNNKFTGGEMSGPIQPLDGIECDRCTISSPVITYAGGAFSCNNCNIHAARVEFKGAALNTVNALRFFGAFSSPKPPPNKPKDRTFEANEIQVQPQDHVNWVSLAGLKH
jgi:hypothetical protein